jgi:DNA-binding response OmpR family regulator
VDRAEQGTAPRVLVADDEDDVRALVCLAVRRADGTVAAAVPDGTAALTAARAELPDLTAGADAYLAKPFAVATLVTRVRELTA